MYFAVLQHNGMYFLFLNSFMVFSSSKTATFQILLEGIALISINKTFSIFTALQCHPDPCFNTSSQATVRSLQSSLQMEEDRIYWPRYATMI